MSSRRAFQATLPRKRVAAGALFTNIAGEILLVEPSYKPTWEIPGGATELNESPLEGCRREVEEELGLQPTIDRLLTVDYNHDTESSTECLIFLFDGGVLSAEQIAQIRLPADELLSYRFFPPDQLPEALPPALRWRILQTYAQLKQTGGRYLENGPRKAERSSKL